MEGILLVDKPKGWTSFDVVNYVRKLVSSSLGVKPKNIKVGHIGTLDPVATGLLVILIGKSYTKKATELSKLDKIYEVEFRLGITSPSFDTETKIEKVSDDAPELDALEKVVNSFKGEIQQIPPIYSAIKVNGQRAYNLARKGQDIEMKPRTINIYDIDLTEYSYPIIRLRTHVSSGTYIRSLVRDIGQNLGTGAVMTELKRTKIGKFNLTNSLKVEGTDIQKISEHVITKI